MKLVVTVREILDKGVWDEFCEEFGINPWARNEGLMSDDQEEFTLTEEQARRLRFIKEQPNDL